MKKTRSCLKQLLLLLILLTLLPLNVSAETNDTADLFGQIAINELVVSASPYAANPGYDWIELKNTSRTSQKLQGWRIELNGKKSFTFSSGVVYAGDYLCVYCTEKTLNNKNISCGFDLPRKSGTLCLYDAEGNLVSRVTWKDLPGNIAWGRSSDDGPYVLLSKKTPGSKNVNTGSLTRSTAPVFDNTPGYYSKGDKITLSAPTGETIYYTLDGSEPTEKSNVYTGPITLTKLTVIRASAKAPDKIMSEVISGTYFVDLNYSFTVVSVICDPQSLYSDTGILSIGDGSIPNFLQDLEYPANIEYYSADGTLVISQLCGMKVAGAISRYKGQKSLAFFARNAYGKDRFSFNPFPHRDYDSIKGFVLRAAGSEGLADGIRFRDALLTSLAMDSNCLVTDAAPALVYINGKLWGHCNIRERANKYFLGELEGVDEDDLDKIDILTEDGLASQGSAKDYKELSFFMKTNDLNKPDNLAYVLERLDVDSLFDCVAYHMIAGNPDLSNLRFYRIPGGKWKWMLYDFDTAMRGLEAFPIIDFTRDFDDRQSETFDPIPFMALMKVPEMRDKFLRRIAQILIKDFSYDNIYSKTMAWHDALLPIIKLHCQVWTELTVDNWENNIKERLKIMHDRPLLIPSYIQQYFKLTDEETNEYFGEYFAQIKKL